MTNAPHMYPPLNLEMHRRSGRKHHAAGNGVAA
jgi:hypothetical protein